MSKIEAPLYRDMFGFYGQPGENLVKVAFPYPMRIAWDLNYKVHSTQCHALVKDSFEAILERIMKNYDAASRTQLGIDIFGGMYNLRRMRNGNRWSTHAWAAAIDLYPQMNRLEWGRDKAVFAKPEYKPMIDSFYEFGWYSQGVELNNDYMHFQAVRYK